MSGRAACIGGLPLTKDERRRFDHNVALMEAHHAKTREPVVWRRVDFDGTEYRPLEVVDHWDGIARISEQFLQHRNKDLAPCVGRKILVGALMKDDSRYAGEGIPAAPPKAVMPQPVVSIAPIAPMPVPPKPEPAPPLPFDPAPDTEGLLARAKAAIARGVNKEAVMARLRSFGVTTEI
jgi:hypothetical protein